VIPKHGWLNLWLHTMEEFVNLEADPIETLEDEVAFLPTLLPCSSISPPSDSPDSA
jgi:hypothetical protein